VKLSILKDAPSTATRIREHVLEIRFATGVKRFTDKPPYEELSGIRWTYCGYDKENKIHLIGKSDEALLQGFFFLKMPGKS
jgi:hypothetical protein